MSEEGINNQDLPPKPHAPSTGEAPVPPANQAPVPPAGNFASPGTSVPTGAAVPVAPTYAPAPPNPQMPPAPLVQLSGGMKFAWLVVGLMLTIPGVILSWLINVDKHPQVKRDAVKFSLIGFVISIVVGILIFILMVSFVAAVAAAAGSGLHSSYYGSYGSW